MGDRSDEHWHASQLACITTGITTGMHHKFLHAVALTIEHFHSRGQQPTKFVGTKESVHIRKEFNSHGIGLGHQHGCRDVMWKHSIAKVSATSPLLLMCQAEDYWLVKQRVLLFYSWSIWITQSMFLDRNLPYVCSGFLIAQFLAIFTFSDVR